MVTSDLQVSLSCSCGKTITARAKDAGSSIVCICGKYVAVPKLSQLRTLAGAAPFVTNPAEAIRKLQAEGINSAGDRCVLCKSASVVQYTCHAHCESIYEKPSSTALDESPMPLMAAAFDYIIVEPLFRLLFRRGGSNTERTGYDIEVTFALPICNPCVATVGDVTRPKVAMRLMREVPLLVELLAYYPQLTLTVEHP